MATRPQSQEILIRRHQEQEDNLSMSGSSENWVFLGDSLTEGVGSRRVSFVQELASLLRGAAGKEALRQRSGVHYVRLRQVDVEKFNPYVAFNRGGFIDQDLPAEKNVWLWNLACEGTTITSEEQTLPLLLTLRPRLVVIFRGALESILRTRAYFQNSWPRWVPRSWRGYASMDPRCYFSTTWWRRWKQMAVDQIKQKIRLSRMRQGGLPLQSIEAIIQQYNLLLRQLRAFSCRTIVCGMLPVSEQTFPGSNQQLASLNGSLRELAGREGADFLDWGNHPSLQKVQTEGGEKVFYRDGFHPNLEGSRILAGLLFEHLRAHELIP